MDIKLPLINSPATPASLNNAQQVKALAEISPVTPVSSQFTANEYQQQLLQETLRQSLPHQISPALLLTQLSQNLSDFNSNGQISITLKNLLNQLIQNLPQIQDLYQPQRLAQALQDTGLFLEAKLAKSLDNTAPQIQQDLKANLLTLNAAFQEQLQPNHTHHLSDDELAKLTVMQKNITGALHHLLLDQVASLPKEDALRQVWFVEIPFLSQDGANSLKFEVEKDAGKSAEHHQDPAWSVTMTLNPPGLDTLYCKVNFAEGALNTYFRSENADTAEMIGYHIQQLREKLTEANLNLGHMDSQIGHWKKDLSSKLSLQTILDAKA